MNNKDDVKKIIEAEEVPEELSPENVKEMIDEKAPSKKRSGISIAGRITALAAACALIVGTTLQTTKYLKHKDDVLTGNYSAEGSGNGNKYATSTAETLTGTIEDVPAPYMIGAKDYKQVYKLIEKAKKHNNEVNMHKNVDIISLNAVEDVAESSAAIAPAYDEETIGAADDFVSSDKGEAYREPLQATEYGGGYVDSEPTTEFAPITAPPEVTTEPTEVSTQPEVTTEPATATPSEETTVDSEVTTTATDDGEETTTTTTTTAEETEDDDDFSETYNQEKGVLEADIVKTDGKKIYYLNNNDSDEYYMYNPVLNIATVDNGKFTDTAQIFVSPESYLDEGWEATIQVNDMYLYNDLIAVIGTENSYLRTEIDDREYSNYYDDDLYFCQPYYNYEQKSRCFVSFYTKDAELVGTYWQDGDYSDVRISPDGYMYLVSSYRSYSFYEIENEDETEKYIPECGIDDNFCCMPPEDILLPKKLDNYSNLSYTIIGSIDLTVSAQFTPVDSKALAGYTGNLYSSANNIYVTVGWEDTDITRLAVNAGNIVPAASGKVDGCVKDQFSMSEYDGYFRIATTVNKWVSNGNFITDMFGVSSDYDHVQDNRVYVLDMDLNTVGFVGGFGKDESIKSVNFSGNMGYVVTYRQTDPLFAIDLSDPTDPFITDEFKILGYSTYMQSWSDGLLLGFGVDADENGIENGVKLVMFDNSDPYNLREVGLYAIHRDEEYLYSSAVWDRKQLLIAPEKNLIGVPIQKYNNYGDTSEYMFFSYENGEFIPRGEISKEIIWGEGDCSSFDRAVYIGKYVYVLSSGKFVSADIETLTVTDEVTF